MDFTETQRQTLQAVCDCLIPPDDAPGAWDAGVGDFIVRLLDTDCQHLQEDYRLGLDAIRGEALAQFGSGFEALTAAQQESLLRQIEQGEVRKAWAVPPQHLLSLLITHTAEGYYSDPDNGGNRNECAWRMIGF